MLGAWLSTTFGVTSCLIGVDVGFSIQLAIISLAAPARIASLDGLRPDDSVAAV